MGDIRVVINDAGARAILQGSAAPAVTAKLLAMGYAISRAAQASAPGSSFTVRNHVGVTRARVTVGTANEVARKAEATSRTLTLALNAGRQ